MTKELPFIFEYYNREIVKMIGDKYGIPAMDALRRFLGSETYQMLVNLELEMWEFSPGVIFDMWEAEQVTGSPQNSCYLRRD